MIDFTQLLSGAIPLLFVIFGLVEFIKSLGLSGRGLTIASVALGVCLGMLYRISEIGLPVGFPAWFQVVIFGLALGLVASGFYDFANKRFPER